MLDPTDAKATRGRQLPNERVTNEASRINNARVQFLETGTQEDWRDRFLKEYPDEDIPDNRFSMFDDEDYAVCRACGTIIKYRSKGRRRAQLLKQHMDHCSALKLRSRTHGRKRITRTTIAPYGTTMTPSVYSPHMSLSGSILGMSAGPSPYGSPPLAKRARLHGDVSLALLATWVQFAVSSGMTFAIFDHPLFRAAVKATARGGACAPRGISSETAAMEVEARADTLATAVATSTASASSVALEIVQAPLRSTRDAASAAAAGIQLPADAAACSVAVAACVLVRDRESGARRALPAAVVPLHSEAFAASHTHTAALAPHAAADAFGASPCARSVAATTAAAATVAVRVGAGGGAYAAHDDGAGALGGGLALNALDVTSPPPPSTACLSPSDIASAIVGVRAAAVRSPAILDVISPLTARAFAFQLPPLAVPSTGAAHLATGPALAPPGVLHLAPHPSHPQRGVRGGPGGSHDGAGLGAGGAGVVGGVCASQLGGLAVTAAGTAMGGQLASAGSGLQVTCVWPSLRAILHCATLRAVETACGAAIARLSAYVSQAARSPAAGQMMAAAAAAAQDARRDGVLPTCPPIPVAAAPLGTVANVVAVITWAAALADLRYGTGVTSVGAAGAGGMGVEHDGADGENDAYRAGGGGRMGGGAPSSTVRRGVRVGGASGSPPHGDLTVCLAALPALALASNLMALASSAHATMAAVVVAYGCSVDEPFYRARAVAAAGSLPTHIRGVATAAAAGAVGVGGSIAGGSGAGGSPGAAACGGMAGPGTATAADSFGALWRAALRADLELAYPLSGDAPADDGYALAGGAPAAAAAPVAPVGAELLSSSPSAASIEASVAASVAVGMPGLVDVAAAHTRIARQRLYAAAALDPTTAPLFLYGDPAAQTAPDGSVGQAGAGESPDIAPLCVCASLSAVVSAAVTHEIGAFVARGGHLGVVDATTTAAAVAAAAASASAAASGVAVDPYGGGSGERLYEELGTFMRDAPVLLRRVAAPTVTLWWPRGGLGVALPILAKLARDVLTARPSASETERVWHAARHAVVGDGCVTLENVRRLLVCAWQGDGMAVAGVTDGMHDGGNGGLGGCGLDSTGGMGGAHAQDLADDVDVDSEGSEGGEAMGDSKPLGDDDYHGGGGAVAV